MNRLLVRKIYMNRHRKDVLQKFSRTNINGIFNQFVIKAFIAVNNYSVSDKKSNLLHFNISIHTQNVYNEFHADRLFMLDDEQLIHTLASGVVLTR